MSELMLSIYVATYNHEKYIARALDSILMQKTEYLYEVLVGEDCSTDGTRVILKEYEEKYPGRFQMFYREHNMYKEKIRNGEDLKRRCRGKYLIALEGDDFWTDEDKLQKQIEFLETHPEYLAVAHNCVVVDEYSQPNGEKYAECKDEEYTVRHLACEILPGQLTTIMYRNFYREDILDASLCKSDYVPGDRCIFFTLVTCGKVYCMQEIMSAYRHITTNGTSYSATTKYNFASYERLYNAFISYAKEHSHKENEKYAEYLYMYNVLLGLKTRQITLKEGVGKSKKVSKRLKALWMCIYSLFNRKVLKKNLFV